MKFLSYLTYALSHKRVCAPASREDITVVSYNVRYFNNVKDFGKRHWYVRAKYVLRNVENLQPDVLCLQEVHPPQFAYFKKHLVGYNAVIGYREERGVHSEACPIFYNATRFTLLDSGTFWLSDTPNVISKFEDSWHYRIASFARLQDKDGKVLTVYNVHPDYRIEDVRVRQLAVLADKVAHTEGNVAVTGDFNAKKGERCLEPFESMLRECRDFRGDDFGVTFNGFDDEEAKAIDFIYLPKDCTLVETGIDKTLFDGIYPSDHYPIYARIIL